MTIEDLRLVLKGVGIEPTPGELADALWLAMLAAGYHSAETPSRAPPPARLPDEPDRSAAGTADPSPMPPADPLPPAPASKPPAPGDGQDDLDVRLPAPTAADTAAASQAPVHAAVGPALPDPLALARALRPLRRRLASGRRVRIDEEATADLGAEQRLWLPVLAPVGEPALDLTLVIDASESMEVWDTLIREFRLICEHVGAFGDIRSTYLTTGQAGSPPRPALRGASTASAARDPRELVDPSGRRLILVITDGVHPWWQPSGPLPPVLARWAAASPVAIIQPFPQRLWHRSTMRPAIAEFRPSGPGRHTARITRPPHGAVPGTRPASPETGVIVPVLELAPAVLDRWARLVAGSGPATMLAATMLTGEPAGWHHPRTSSGHASPAAFADAAETVRAFRASVSPAAYRLAGYLSVVAPLTLPVMRLVQESTLPDAGPAELAEVFLSGLLRRLPDAYSYEAQLSYGFTAGTREILQSTLTRAEALSLLDQTGSYLIRGQRAGRSFPAIVSSPPSGNLTAAAQKYPPFARVASQVLERIGGPFAEAARKITPAARSCGYPEDWLDGENPYPRISLTQPMLFVGLGGAGCDIGAELERRLREEICGPDGNAFRNSRGTFAGMLPYQLPSCVQFVYADLNQAELDRLPSRVVPSAQHMPAALHTAHYVRSLVPRVDSYPELARHLRLEAPRATAPWLPPEQGEPRVNPLHRGTGQFPTIGRAALFGTLAEDVSPAPDLHTAVGRLATSGENLHALGGRAPSEVDVFVAFSVAGGTGGGIFYDYLHLIGDTFRQTQLRVKIYPLVLMPSAFEPGLGGGRAAELNAGRALLDLFRLVDQQNGADAQRELRSLLDQRPIDPEEVAVDFPQNRRIVLRPGTVQTGFLFSQPAGATRRDMRRSIVSMVMSLVGTEISENDDWPARSFADSFVNEAAHRQVRAGNGIGDRGVSTALTASLTVPVDDLAGVISARLLRTAIEQLSTPIGTVESNRADMEDFLIKAGVHPVLRRSATDFAEPEPVRGVREVTAALNDRREAMKAGIVSLKAQLGRDVPQLVSAFHPSNAVRELLGRMDVFRVQRVLFGHPELADEADRAGVAEILHRRPAAPAPPDGSGAAPPPVPELKDWFVRKVGWHDEAPVAARSQQDAWYTWATQTAWAESWAAHTPQWRRPLERVQEDLTALTKALTEFAYRDHEDFRQRSADLYRKRVGVSYLLPPAPGGLQELYRQIITRLGERLNPEMHGASEAELLRALLGADGWRDAFQLSVEHGPERAVNELRERLKTAVKTLLVLKPPGQQALLPELNVLLAEQAGHSTPASTLPGYPEELRRELAALVPSRFAPQGRGPLKVLISYPAAAPDSLIERHLGSSINLPVGHGIEYEYRPARTGSITVVLFRTAMGLTEVDEVRNLLRLWAGALARPEPADLLRWRQRTGYDFGYLAMREEHRVEILHRLLCALWNGKAAVVGPATSPEQVLFHLGDMAVALRLTPLGEASSWGSLLRAYELWALDDDDIHQRFCAQLMRELPGGLDGRPQLPDHLYLVLRDLAEGQIECLDDMMKQQAAGQRFRAAQMRGFWATALPAALDHEFTGLEAPIAENLRGLEVVASP